MDQKTKNPVSRRLPLWGFLFLIPLSWGCAERPQAPEMVGAPASSPSEGAPPPPIFPHTDDWADPASHGAWVVEFDSQTCLGCHKIDSTLPETIPTCSSCHPLFPHGTDWVKKENHGGEVFAGGQSSCATQCHGTDLNGGLSGISCNLCHTTYPHPANWASPAVHGNTVLSNGKAVCRSCHGGDLMGEGAAVSCRQCHTIYPHETDWDEPDQHGGHVLGNGTTSCATQCHGADLNGGLSGIGCNSCHDLYPHSEDWGTDHRATALTLGTSACQACHGNNLRTILDGKNCYSCHNDYPHPSPSSWLPFIGGHGQRVQSVYSGSTGSCEACHGNDLATIKPDGKNCFSCHTTYPHDTFSPSGWETYTGHGTYALPPAKKVECQLCHGVDYKGGGRSNPSCFSCHVSYPHTQTGWRRNPGEPQEHGNYVQLNSSSSCATARCHGTDLTPTPGVTNGPGCNSCHESYPHEPGWMAGTTHGPVALANIATCKACHGAQLNEAPAGHLSCQQCHPSYLQHESAELGVANWDTYAGHGQYVMNTLSGNPASCKLCHGNDYLGGLSHVSCKSCHPSFPHDSPGWGTAVGHPDYIDATLGGDLTSCKTCHGNDLTGGHSEVSCGTCHPNFPHSVIPAWSTSGHGTAALTPSGRNGCKTCHGADLLGGTSGISCNGCHTEFPPHAAGWLETQTEMVPGVCCDDDEFEEECWPCEQPVTRMFLHGQKFQEQKAAGFPANPNRCSTCHGADYEGGNSLVSCTACHANYPHVKYGSNWRVDSLLANPLGGQHGPAFLNGPHDLTSPCAQCHIDFGAGLSAIGLPGAAAPACSSCHVYPHLRIDMSPDSWIYRAGVPPGYPHGWQYNHGWRFIMESYGESHGGDPNFCKDCHGANLMGGGGPANEAKRCSRCHTTGAVSHAFPTWRPSEGHGKNYIRARLAGFPADSPDRCLECHSSGPTRCPVVPTNPFVGEFPASGADWCNACHKAPPATCP